MMKVEPGQGTKKELGSAPPDGSWSSGSSVSLGVKPVPVEEEESCFGVHWSPGLRTILAECWLGVSRFEMVVLCTVGLVKRWLPR